MTSFRRFNHELVLWKKEFLATDLYERFLPKERGPVTI